MNACTRLTSWISSSLMLALIAGCGVGGGALKFNQAIVAANEKLGAAGVKYGEAIPAALNGGEQELMKLKAAYTEMTNTVASVKAEVSALTVPNDKTSQDLSTAYLDFLRGQDRLVAKFGEVIPIIENKKLSAPQKQAKVLAILKESENMEGADLAKLQAAQQAFARDHNIKLRNK